jgi:hypothetical protein
MEYFRIPGFRPIEAKEDATNQDRGVLRTCEGFAAYPQGALCAGPQWKPLWDLSGLKDLIETALEDDEADPEKAHFVLLTKDDHQLLICWSMPAGIPLGWFVVSHGSTNDFDTAGATVDAPDDAAMRDKDPDAEWFASPIDGRILLGNGVDDNLVWFEDDLAVFGPSSAPADPNLRSRQRIPPCTVFRQHVNRSIFAAGNSENPLRVWVTDPPNMGEPFIDGIYSLETSFIDVHAHGGATRVTALSVFQQYVTVHTDKKPINLHGVDEPGDGWKCRQSVSAANASAISPSCVGDMLAGDASVYLGSDLEVYFDQAIRSGPFEKRNARAIDIATEQGAGVWNRAVERPITGSGYHTIYDAEERLFWMWLRHASPARGALYVFNERTRTVSGPWRYPDAIASAVVRTTGSLIAIVMTAEGECLYADLRDIGELEPEELEPRGTALGADFAEVEEEPTPTPGLRVVAMPANRSAVLELAGEDDAVGLAQVLGPIQSLDPDDYTLTRFFKDAYIARFDTPWLDFGDPKRFKNFHEVQLSLERDARAYVGIFGETDSGRTSGKWIGQVHGKDIARGPLNLFGRKIRVRLVAIMFNGGRCLIRDMQVGYSVGGTD